MKPKYNDDFPLLAELEWKDSKIGDDFLEEIDNRDSEVLAKEKSISKIKTLKLIKKYAKTHFKKVQKAWQILEIPKKNEQIKYLTQGAFNSFTVILYFLEKYNVIEELYLTTFNIKENVIETLFYMLEQGKIKKLRLLVSESVSFRMPNRYRQIIKKTKESKQDVKTKFCWNHSKIMIMKTGEINYVIEGSGNLSDNAQIEQYSSYNDKEIYNWYKKWIDGMLKQDNYKREETYGI